MRIQLDRRGGNAPRGRTFATHGARALDRLAGMGEWMKRHCRSIYGCTQAPAELGSAPQDCRYTYDPKTNMSKAERQRVIDTLVSALLGKSELCGRFCDVVERGVGSGVSRA